MDRLPPSILDETDDHQLVLFYHSQSFYSQKVCTAGQFVHFLIKRSLTKSVMRDHMTTTKLLIITLVVWLPLAGTNIAIT